MSKSSAEAHKKPRSFLLKISIENKRWKNRAPKVDQWNGHIFRTGPVRKSVDGQILSAYHTDTPAADDQLYIWINQSHGREGVGLAARSSVASVEIEKSTGDLAIQIRDVELFEDGASDGNRLLDLVDDGNVFFDINKSRVAPLRYLSNEWVSQLDKYASFGRRKREARAETKGEQSTSAINIDDVLSKLAKLEVLLLHANVKTKERIVKKIERGEVGDTIKKLNEYKCQLCEALGMNPLGFLKKGDRVRYVEAHHVMPVSNLRRGSLAGSNIMTLCANHHREVHYGDVEVKISSDTFDLVIGGKGVKLRRLVVGRGQ